MAQLFPRFQRDNVSFRSLRFSVHPSFGGRRLFVGERTNRDLTDEQQTPPLPFVATRRVSSAPPHRAREIGDRRPLQDWPIGPCYCPFWPKDCQFGPQGPSIQAGMPKYKFAQMGAS